MVDERTGVEGVTASEVAGPAGRHRLLVDIRPLAERAEIGFLPGSISCPISTPRAADAASLRARLFGYPSESVVLVCLTGRRSGEALTALRASYPKPISHLVGGQLRWQAEGLPTCGARVVDPPLSDPAARVKEPAKMFVDTLRACFVAEMVERLVDDPVEHDLDVLALLRRCYEAEGVEMEHPDVRRLPRVIEHLGAVSRQMGTEMRTIADNTDRLLAMLAGRPGEPSS